VLSPAQEPDPALVAASVSASFTTPASMSSSTSTTVGSTVDPNGTSSRFVDGGQPGKSPIGTSSRLKFTEERVFGRHYVECTPLGHIPNCKTEKYLGRVYVHFIKEIWSYREQGGLGTFVYRFLAETNAIARAHVTARGGNALLGYRLTQCRVFEPNKNQAYGIISVSGEAARVRSQPPQPAILIPAYLSALLPVSVSRSGSRNDDPSESAPVLDGS